ncbi:MAG: hypothetical protein BWZ10_01421 [candidate division BRC1 bacterium ADurb.BinA364]|nr:MAG: hypothetical protein BWZ10_01421 [candidate division BRC1 bacterium ADurb.BinA364]
MAKTQRERILLWTTVALAVAGLAYTQLENSGLFQSLAQSGSGLEALRSQYAAYQQVLKRKARIEQKFVEIEQQYEKAPGLSPDKQFKEQVNNMCREYNFQGVQIDKTRLEDIENVEEYKLLYVPVHSVGTWPDLVNLLKRINSAGFLVDELDIRAARDSPNLSVDIVIARPVKQSEMPEYREAGI